MVPIIPTDKEIMLPYFGPFLESELASRRKNEANDGKQSNRMTQHFFVSSSSKNHRLEEITKEHEEMSEKLNDLILTVKDFVDFVKNLHQYEVFDRSNFMMQGDVYSKLYDDFGN